MKKVIALACALVCASAVFAGGASEASATKYYVGHQGGYIGEAMVTVAPDGKVAAASYAEWHGPGGWAEYNDADKKALLDGAVVRVPDPLGNASSTDPAIKGYTFYIWAAPKDAPATWITFAPGKDAFARGTKWERDFEGMMSNPIRAEAYAKAAKEDTLVNVTIEGLKVTVGKKASETVHYGHMNKADKTATYMPVAAASIGYRYNYKATVDFFKANPTVDFAAATIKKMKLPLVADATVDAGGKEAAYTAAEDNVYVVADAVTGATFSDFQHYSLELQTAYKMALAAQKVKFQK